MYYLSALKLGLPVIYLSELGCLKLSFGERHFYFNASVTPLNTGSGICLNNNKFHINTLLRQRGFPVPLSVSFPRTSFSRIPLDALIQGLQFPLVAKPMRKTHPDAYVVCNIQSPEELHAHLKEAFVQHQDMHVERYHEGLKAYRVLVLDNHVIAVVLRASPTVVGDGVHTIEALMEKTPTLPKACLRCLSAQSLGLTDTPSKGRVVRLRYDTNQMVSLGTTLRRCNAKKIIEAARLTGLEWVGFDLLCEDITRPFLSGKWFILGTDYDPDITVYELPDKGVPVQVSIKLLKKMITQNIFAYFTHRCRTFCRMLRGVGNG
jgi:cyanophycin synthetase